MSIFGSKGESDNFINTQVSTEYFTDADRAAVKLSAEDKLEIIELTNRFNWCVDTRNYDRLGELFTADAVLDHMWGYVEGAGKIIELVSGHRQDEEGVRHQSTNHVVTANADGTANMICYLLVLRIGRSPRPATPYVLAHAVQTYRLRRENGVWRCFHLAVDQSVLAETDSPDEASRELLASTADVRRAEMANQQGQGG